MEALKYLMGKNNGCGDKKNQPYVHGTNALDAIFNFYITRFNFSRNALALGHWAVLHKMIYFIVVC